MKGSILSAATALCALFGTSTSSPIPGSAVTRRLHDHLHVRQGGFFAVTGPTGGLQPRLEIRELQKNAPMWNLFLAAFEQWQAMDQNDKLSYFQIAAIHGQPLISWDGVEATGSPNSGYCPHDSNQFGTWHRPYLAVVEQLIQQQAYSIVGALPEGEQKNQYQELANQLRFPYWDWAMNPADNGPTIPASVTSQNVDIAYPNGTTINRPNPLYQYTFHPLDPSWFGGIYNQWQHTVRNPADVSQVNSASNNGQAEANLRGQLNSLRGQLYNQLTQHQSFNQFSNHGSGNSPLGSLESLHDGIHAIFGEGHMLYLTVSAFDPIFWLHHANVDRLIVLFQSIYPDTWIESFNQTGDTWVYNTGTTLDKYANLAPFHSSTDGTFWNSATGAGWEQFSYTYPEIADRPSNETLRARVNTLYGTGNAAQAVAPNPGSPGAAAMTNSRTSSINAKRDLVHARALGGKAYLAAIEAPLQALNGPYTVQVYLGNVPDDLQAFSSPNNSDSNYVGSFSVMAQPGMQNDDVVRGSVPLTRRLNENSLAGLLDSVGLKSVLGTLKVDLHYRVLQNGAEVPKEKIPGLKVAVFSADVTPPERLEDFPVWGKLTKHKDVDSDGWASWPDEDEEGDGHAVRLDRTRPAVL